MKYTNLLLCLVVSLLAPGSHGFWVSDEITEYESPNWDSFLADEDQEYSDDGDGGRVVFTVLTNNDDDLGEGVNTEDNEVNPPEERGQEPESEDIPDSDAITVKKLSEKVDKFMTEVKAQQDKIIGLEEENKKLLAKVDSIEQQTKTNSIIMSNVPQSARENHKTTLQKVLHVINRILRVRTSPDDIAVALRAESDITEEGHQPIVVRFTNFATKMKVLSASNRLSTRSNIKISSDYSEMVAKRRAGLLPYLERAREQGHRAFILYDKLVIDGVKKTLEELQAAESRNPDEQVEELAIDPRFGGSDLR